MRQEQRPTVSIIIKAFNEERHIAGAIESALDALDTIDGEVILADGASTDRTIAIACGYPIRIVRLDNPAERSCGAGAQLGYQYSAGKFLCLMDGDMRLHPGFIAAGVRFLEENPTHGGVGGIVIDCGIDNLEYEQRANRPDPNRRPGQVKRLNCFGIYRRSAVDSIGYVTDRNLHGGEELDLAARLQVKGWKLARIDLPAVDHYVHRGNAFRLLLRRIRSRYAFAPGEVFRAAIGRPHFGFIVRNDRNMLLCGLVAAWWCLLAAMAIWGKGIDAMLALAALAILPFAIMSARWRSLPSGVYSVVAWNVHALCFLPGLLRSRRPPAQWMTSSVVKDTPAHPASHAARYAATEDAVQVALTKR
jgi:glycosyltransferase involved in cell wall biosynthesis